MRDRTLSRRLFVASAVIAAHSCALAAGPGPAASKMASQVDEVEKITWYRDKSTPKTPIRTIAYLYMGKKSAAPWLRFKLQYWGDNWLFVEKATIVIDGQKQGEVGGKWERDNGSGSVWEVSDLAVDQSNIRVIKAMAAAKSVLVRFEGRKYYKDYKLPAAEIQAMKNVLAAFEEMGGKV